MSELFEEVLDHALVVVAPAEDVIQGGKAVSLTAFLLMIELHGVELVTADNAPVIAGGVHGEAWSQRTVDADNHRILAGSAVPREMVAFHEVHHLPEARVRVHHLVAGILLFRQPLNGVFNCRPVILRDVGDVVCGVLEMLILLDEWRLIDVIIGGDAILVCDLGKLPNVVKIVAADIDVEENRVAVSVLLPNQVIKLLSDRSKGLGQTFLDIDCATAILNVDIPESASLSITSVLSRRAFVGR